MRCNGGSFSSSFGAWRDRVADPDGDLFSDLPDGIEEIATDAMFFAQGIIERVIEPLIDVLGAFPHDFSQRHRSGTNPYPPDEAWRFD